MCYLPAEAKVVVFWLKRENNSSLISYRALIIFILWVEKYIYWNFKFEYNLEFGKNYFVENKVDWNAIYDVWKLMKARKALPVGK